MEKNKEVVKTAKEEAPSNQRANLRIWEEREQEHRDTLGRLAHQIDTKQHELTELTNEVSMRSAVLQEIDGCAKLLSDLRDRIVAEKNRLKQVQESSATAQQHLDETKTRIEGEERRAREVRDEVEHLRQNADFLNRRVAELRTEEIQINESLAKGHNDLTEQHKKNEHLEAQLKQQQTAIHTAVAKIKSLDEQTSEHTDRLAAQAKEEKARLEVIAGLVEQIDQKKKEVAAAEVRTEENEKRVFELQSRTAELDARNEAIRGEFAHLQIQIGQTNAELSALVEKRDRMSAEVRDLHSQRDIGQTEVSSLKQRQAKVEQTIATQEITMQEHEKTINNNNSLINELETQLQRKTSSISKLNEQIEYFEGKLLSLRDKNVELEMRGRVLTNQLRETEERIDLLHGEAKNFEAKISHEREILAGILEDKARTADEIRAHEENLISRERELQRLKEQIRGETKKWETLENEIRSRREILQSLDVDRIMRKTEIEKYDEAIRQLRNQENELIAQKASLETAVSSLREQETLAEKNLSTILKRIDAERLRFNEETEKASVAQDLAERSKARMDETNRELSTLYSQRDHAQMELLNVQKHALEKTEELGELEILRQDKINRIDELVREIQGLRREKDSLEQTLRDMPRNNKSRGQILSIRDNIMKILQDYEDPNASVDPEDAKKSDSDTNPSGEVIQVNRPKREAS